MLFNIIFKQYLNIFIRNFILCIQIRFVSTEKTTRIASRASCLLLNVNDYQPSSLQVVGDLSAIIMGPVLSIYLCIFFYKTAVGA